MAEFSTAGRGAHRRPPPRTGQLVVAMDDASLRQAGQITNLLVKIKKVKDSWEELKMLEFGDTL